MPVSPETLTFTGNKAFLELFNALTSSNVLPKDAAAAVAKAYEGCGILGKQRT